MAINKNSLQARINNLSRDSGINQNILLKSFFFDAFLKRLEKSPYHYNFIFKGGFLLSTSLGIKMRSTMDIDFLLRKIPLVKEEIIKIINDICNVDIDDNVAFEYRNIAEIRDNDDYGGYNVSILGKLENIKEVVSIDVATGDPITPHVVDYQYRCMFDDSVLLFKAYNYETILAEKLQTILFRGLANSRSKDYYDFYIIYQTKWQDINIATLKEAFYKTCKYRGTMYSPEDVTRIVSSIKGDKLMKSRLDLYKNKNIFASGIEFAKTVECIETITNLILLQE